MLLCSVQGVDARKHVLLGESRPGTTLLFRAANETLVSLSLDVAAPYRERWASIPCVALSDNRVRGLWAEPIRVGPAAAPWLVSGHSAERGPGHRCHAGRVISRVPGNAPRGLLGMYTGLGAAATCHPPPVSPPASGLHNPTRYQWSKSSRVELCIPEAITFHANLQAPPGAPTGAGCGACPPGEAGPLCRPLWVFWLGLLIPCQHTSGPE